MDNNNDNAESDFARFDRENARTTPLEDFFHADIYNRIPAESIDPSEDAARLRLENGQHMTLRGVGGTKAVRKSKAAKGNKRAADTTTQDTSNKQPRFGGQSHVYRRATSDDAGPSTDQDSNALNDLRQARETADEPIPAPKPGTRHATSQSQDATKTFQKPRKPLADAKLPNAYRVMSTAGTFQEVGPTLARLSKRPVFDESMPDQFVFEKNLADERLYTPSYGKSTNVKVWWNAEEKKMRNRDLKNRQLAVHNIVGESHLLGEYPLDFEGNPVPRNDDPKSLYMELWRLINDYNYTEYSEHDEVYDKKGVPIREPSQRKLASTGFAKFLAERAAVFAKRGIKDVKKNCNKNASEGDERGEEVEESVWHDLAMVERVVVRDALPVIVHDAAELQFLRASDEVYGRLAEQQDVEMTDAPPPEGSEQGPSQNSAGESSEKPLQDPQIEIFKNSTADLKRIRKQQRKFGKTLAAHAVELERDPKYRAIKAEREEEETRERTDEEEEEEEQAKQAVAAAKGFRMENKKLEATKKRGT